MNKRPFFSCSKSNITYQRLPGKYQVPKEIQPSEKAVYIYKSDSRPANEIPISAGMKIKTGQRLPISNSNGAYIVSTVTGTVSKVSLYAGDFGQNWIEVVVSVSDPEKWDDRFASLAGDPNLETAVDFLTPTPGAPDLRPLTNPDTPIRTIVVSAVEKDLLTATAQYIVKEQMDDIATGIKVLKAISGIDDIILAVPSDTVQNYGGIGAKAVAVDTVYPAGLPLNIMKDVLHQPVPVGKTCEDLGVFFISAEGTATIGRAFQTGRIPTDKVLTLIDKSGRQQLVSAKIGTPVSLLLDRFGITVKDKDRIIFGGPMTGSAIYAEDHPVEPDTDAVMVQDENQIPFTTDYPCINCGDCIRACPVNVPVNMLVRLLEAGQYETAADEYDLYSCIECGLCSFVCVAKIPIFQYIKLAKFELERIQSAEALNE